jgi:hypothetical protein
MSASVMVCTSDLFARNADGKAEGFDRVMIVLTDVSTGFCISRTFRKRVQQVLLEYLCRMRRRPGRSR